jgi:hypothetical protein
MNKFAVFICSALAGVFLLAVNVAADSDYGWRDEGVSIEGAWQVEMTVRMNAADCTTAPLLPPPAPNPFPAFNMFHAGGTMTEFGSRSPPSKRSPGFGIWERTGKRRYATHHVFQSFDDNGFLVAVMDWHSKLALSRDGLSFEGVSRFVRTDTSGNAINFCATMTGQRITF